MKKILVIPILLSLFIGFQSCSDDDSEPPCTELIWFEDADGDGRGNPNSSVSDCDQPDGFVSNSDDVDDTCVETLWFEDMDGDGLGNPAVSVESCTQPDGFIGNSNDDDDTDNGQVTFTVWEGEAIEFTKANNADFTMAANQDQITDNISITRDNDGGSIFNIATESDFVREISPEGTEWAMGTTDNIASLTFEPFGVLTQGSQGAFVGDNMVLHLIELDVYVPVTFSFWQAGRNNGGGFTYTRATP